MPRLMDKAKYITTYPLSVQRNVFVIHPFFKRAYQGFTVFIVFDGFEGYT